MRVSPIERDLGIEIFATKTAGIGGVIRQTPEDFTVQEILLDGSKAEIQRTQYTPRLLEGRGRYLICLLVKRKLDTLLTVRKIAKQLGISERRVQIAGIKDKNAVTAQHISIENIKPEKLKRVQGYDIQVHPLRYSPNMIFPHMSFGNIFNITIRGIDYGYTSIQTRVSKIKSELYVLNGVPNFFGHQRFGTIRPITHLVGKAIVKNDLEAAVLLFLAKPSPHEHPQSREARQRLQETLDIRSALSNFPRMLVYERLMLSHLNKNPKDYGGAFKRLPNRLSRLFLQAYQSHLFNRFLSQRMMQKISINEPQLGDYVVRIDRYGLPTRSHMKASTHNIEDLRKEVKEEKKCVAIPLIGYKLGTSDGRQGEIEQNILEEEGVVPADFQVSSNPKMGARGGLRVALAPIIDLDIKKAEDDDLNSKKRSLNIRFVLHRGCYATVVLREFMKPRKLIEAGF